MTEFISLLSKSRVELKFWCLSNDKYPFRRIRIEKLGEVIKQH